MSVSSSLLRLRCRAVVRGEEGALKEAMSGLSAAGGSAGARAAFSYCARQVRTYEYHHYLCLLRLPPAARQAAFALRAFNIETAKAMDTSSNPRTGLMRLLWWQEALDKVFSGRPVEHPVAQALSSSLGSEQRVISKRWLKRSVEARVSDAQRERGEPPETMAEMERYAENTQSGILYSILQAAGVRSAAADHAASHLGKASGLLLLLKAFPYHLGRTGRITHLPREVAEKHGLVAAGSRDVAVEPSEKFSEAVFEVAAAANAHLQRARELRGSVPPPALPVLLPAVAAQVFLDSLRRAGFDVFDPRLARGVMGVSPLWFQMKVAWHAWRSSY